MNFAAVAGGALSRLSDEPEPQYAVAARAVPAIGCTSSEEQAAQLRADGAAGLPVFAGVPSHGLLPAFQSIVNLIVVALFIITFTVQPFRIPSASMEPTLLVGDFLLVEKQVGFEVASHWFPPAGEIHRGDVVIFHFPVDASLHLVKRVIGLPGDHLRMRDGHVYIDGIALHEPYAVYRSVAPDSYRDEFPMLVNADPGVDSRWWIQMHTLVAHGELTVPPDSYFVLGDNRNDSEDSRYWGLVPRAAIVGKPLLVYFSLNEPDSVPGRAGVAMAGPRAQRAADALVDFARWDRVFHRVQ
jgi:signal peptidase I